MSAPVSYRAEFANQILVSLKKFDEAAWLVCEARMTDRARTFDLAYRLAEDAINLLAEEFGADMHGVIHARLSDVDAIFGMVPIEETLDPGPIRWRVARGAILSVFLRDSRGFNHGAFEELFRPVAAIVELGELERTVQTSLGTSAEDSSALVRPAEQSGPTQRDTRSA